ARRTDAAAGVSESAPLAARDLPGGFSAPALARLLAARGLRALRTARLLRILRTALLARGGRRQPHEPGFALVAVGVAHERHEVVGAVVGPRPRRAVVRAAGLERRALERAHGRFARRVGGDVHAVADRGGTLIVRLLQPDRRQRVAVADAVRHAVQHSPAADLA